MISGRTFVRFRRRFLNPRAEILREYPRLFVVGSPRSGTTWVTQMLQLSPRVITSRESHAFRFVDSVLEDSAWQAPEIRQALKERYLRQQPSRVGIPNYVSLRRLLALADDTLQWARRQPSCSNHEFAARLVREIFDWFFCLRGGTSSDVFLEKSPSHSLCAERILRAFPTCKLVHVLRDGRDVCVSMQMRSLTAEWSPQLREQQIEMWLRYVSAVNRLTAAAEFAGRIHTVKYEDLHRDTETELARLLRFAGLDCSPPFVQRAVVKNCFQNKSKTGPGRHSYKGVVGQWRHVFSDDDIRLYSAKAAEMHRQCGYQLDAKAA